MDKPTVKWAVKWKFDYANNIINKEYYDEAPERFVFIHRIFRETQVNLKKIMSAKKNSLQDESDAKNQVFVLVSLLSCFVHSKQ